MKQKKTRIRVTRTGRRLVITAFLALGFTYMITSCNVTRKVTTEGQYLQRGDTAISIVTRTTETYDASKK